MGGADCSSPATLVRGPSESTCAVKVEGNIRIRDPEKFWK